MRKKIIILFIPFCLLFTLCGEKPHDETALNRLPDIFPDYKNITIPVNIAPLNFKLTDSSEQIYVEIEGKNNLYKMDCNQNIAKIGANKWNKLLNSSVGDSLRITVHSKKSGKWNKYMPFYYSVSPQPIDKYLVYRLIMPGYQTWNEMGIYQRNLENFDQSEILTSKLLPGTCMNCHSFSHNNPDNMILHLREVNNGTILIQKGKMQFLKTKTDSTFGNAAFPYWHPSNRFIAFSIDKVVQIFHSAGENRAEALDMKSDIVVYDIEKNEMITSDLIFSPNSFEIYPSFSPDGKTMFFCSAEAKKLPDEFKKVKYSLCSISFDEQKRKFGNTVDTLISASSMNKSITFPRISPDGKYLVFSMSEYGHSPAYRPDADLYIMDLSTMQFHALDNLNSNNVESYHSWSSNSRWMVFSSRRVDGLYMTPFITYIDEKGNPTKPFLLPQESPDFYTRFLFSFNIPEFSVNKVSLNLNQVEKIIQKPAKQVNFRKTK
ncbi:MAG: hypothetical protein U0W24_16295 [Bacteroidales bacterium]